jgi:hypothetical protein
MKPRVRDSREEIIEQISAAIFECGKPYEVIAHDVGVSKTTINNVAAGRTRWPRPATLFGLLCYFNMDLQVVRKK